MVNVKNAIQSMTSKTILRYVESGGDEALPAMRIKYLMNFQTFPKNNATYQFSVIVILSD